MPYDIIGDIHGCSTTLHTLLGRLGYECIDGHYRHPSRQVIFLGDFIDRGPGQRETLAIVRPMIESGAALAVMGNHEFNAIAYYTLDPASGSPLREHSEKNFKQHRVFLGEYAADPHGYAETIEWFKTLPLWLDLGALRVVHACWESRIIERIQLFQAGSNRLTHELLLAGTREGSWQFESLETLLKGKEIPLIPGTTFTDKDGNIRHNIRIRWWDQNAETYQKIYIGPESARSSIPDNEIAGDHLVDYGHDQPPCFLGHYWMEGEPAPLAHNIACVDYSVAKPGGKLVAYRWDGEQQLSIDKFVWVERMEEGHEFRA